MPKPARVDRPKEKQINLPESLCAQVDLILFSPLEGRVPYGAWSKYIQRLIEQDLSRQQEEPAA